MDDRRRSRANRIRSPSRGAERSIASSHRVDPVGRVSSAPRSQSIGSRFGATQSNIGRTVSTPAASLLGRSRSSLQRLAIESGRSRREGPMGIGSAFRHGHRTALTRRTCNPCDAEVSKGTQCGQSSRTAGGVARTWNPRHHDQPGTQSLSDTSTGRETRTDRRRRPPLSTSIPKCLLTTTT